MRELSERAAELIRREQLKRDARRCLPAFVIGLIFGIAVGILLPEIRVEVVDPEPPEAVPRPASRP